MVTLIGNLPLVVVFFQNAGFQRSAHLFACSFLVRKLFKRVPCHVFGNPEIFIDPLLGGASPDGLVGFKLFLFFCFQRFKFNAVRHFFIKTIPISKFPESRILKVGAFPRFKILPVISFGFHSIEKSKPSLTEMVRT